MRGYAIIGALAAVAAGMVEANVVPVRSEAELMKAADLAVVADVVEIGVAVRPAPSGHYTDAQGVLHVSGFRTPCIRAHVVRRMKGRSASTIIVCTPLRSEASALPGRGRRVGMFLQEADEVWVEVPGAGFGERQARPREPSRCGQRPAPAPSGRRAALCR